MHKYIGFFEDGTKKTVWSMDVKLAEFHLKDFCRLHGGLIKVMLFSRYMNKKEAAMGRDAA